jgi:hypothetical protein
MHPLLLYDQRWPVGYHSNFYYKPILAKSNLWIFITIQNCYDGTICSQSLGAECGTEVQTLPLENLVSGKTEFS